MIKVIKDNTKEEFFTKCGTCGSELSYEYTDINFQKVPYILAPMRSIICPCCGKETTASLQSKEDFEKGFIPPFGGLSPEVFNSCCCNAIGKDLNGD